MPIFGRIDLRSRVGKFTDKQSTIGMDSGIHAASVNCRGAIVVHRRFDSNAKAGKSAIEWHGINLPKSHTHRESSVSLCNFPSEECNITIASRRNTLQPAVMNSPILQRIGPIFRSRPRASYVARPIALERGRAFWFRIENRPRQRKRGRPQSSAAGLLEKRPSIQPLRHTFPFMTVRVHRNQEAIRLTLELQAQGKLQHTWSAAGV